MDMDATNGTVQPPDLRAVGEVLRPAFLLWIVYQCAWGGYYLAMSYAVNLAHYEVIWPCAYLLVTIGIGIVIARFALRDRAACRIFARANRGRLELCLLVGIVGAMVLAKWESGIHGSWSSPGFFEHERGWPLLVCLVTGAVLPAVFEELMFRGVILHRLQQVMVGPMAIATQAMLFSTMHLDGVYLIPHFAFGCLAGFLRTVAGALWPCMLLHGLWNGWITLAQYGWL